MAPSRFALLLALLLVALGLTACAQSSSAAIPSVLTLPSGTKIDVAVIRPLWANLAAPGAPLYAQSTFPVVAGDRLAIPPGTYLEGTIEKLARPTRRAKQAVIEVLFRQIIFANGYVVALPPLPVVSQPPAGPQPAAGPQAAAPSLIDVTVQVTTGNDVLLDNGAPIEVTLATPLALNAAQVAAAAPLSHAPDPNQFKSASLCRPIAGTPDTPGTPDTVIPGTPGTVIPGGPGMPDTVIPGTPATPSTVIPGSPGTPGFPGRACPAPAMVTASKLVSAPLPAAAH